MNNFGANFRAFGANLGQTFGTTVNTVQGSLANVDLNTTSKKLQSSFQNFSQTVRERSGNADDITELPQEYLDLERRVDGLKAAHNAFLKVSKAYGQETYDYPLQLQEGLQEFGSSLSHNITYWAAAATKGTKIPQPEVIEKPEEVHKTLPHALSRAAAAAALEAGPCGLSTALKSYAVAQDQIGAARVVQDEAINSQFLHPWQATLNSSLNAALKSRANVKASRIHLDACRGSLKTATAGPKLEQARMEVEAAEEQLVLATEEAINLMRAVLENPEPIKNLAALIKAQQEFHTTAATALADIQSEVDAAATTAEAEYRKTRAQ